MATANARNKNLAFIGLGVMGVPMAGHLKQSGHEVTVYNRTAAKAERWCQQHEGRSAATPREAAAGADVVFVCVGNDDDVRSVVYGADGVLAGMASGTILIDHTTTSATLAEELASTCAENSFRFIDAPVSGGQAGAENGALTVMCGGDHATFDQIKPIITAYAKQCSLMGRAGQGQRCKMVNQVCITGILQGLSEGLLLAEQAGLDIAQVVETLQHGAAGSWQMANRAETMSRGEFDFGFAIDWMRKDLDYALAEAERYDLALPLADAVNLAYGRLQAKGHGRSDTSALILDVRAEAHRQG